jgi:hypothetical protein
MKKSFIFATIVAASMRSLSCFAETPVSSQQIVAEYELTNHQSESTSLPARKVSSIEIHRDEIEFQSDGKTEILAMNILDQAQAIFDELKSTTKHYRIFAESRAQDWAVEEVLPNGGMGQRMSMQEFAEMAVRQKNSEKSIWNSIKNLSLPNVGTMDPIPWAQNNGAPKLSDTAANKPGQVIAIPPTTTTDVITGTPL